MDSSNIVNHLKASAFNKFKHFLYKYYPRFSKISRVYEDLNKVLMLLHDCLLSLCDFLSIDKFSKNAFQLRIGKNSTTNLYNDTIKRENFLRKKKERL